MFLVGYKEDEKNAKLYEEGAAPCLMCRKMIINSGLEKVYVRETKDKYKIYLVEDWIKDDELLKGQLEY